MTAIHRNIDLWRCGALCPILSGMRGKSIIVVVAGFVLGANEYLDPRVEVERAKMREVRAKEWKAVEKGGGDSDLRDR